MFTWRLALMLAALVLPGATSYAQAPSQEDQSRQHFVNGEAHYRAGRWVEALNEFDLAYTLSPRPEFLVNFAQVYRKLARYDRAIVQCERYLATGPPPAMAEEARRLLAAIREEQARASVRPLPPPEPAPVVVQPAPPPPLIVQPAPIVAAPVIAPSPPKPHRGRAWIWGVVIGAVAVAGGAVALGVVLSSQGVAYPSEPLGRVSFR